MWIILWRGGLFETVASRVLGLLVCEIKPAAANGGRLRNIEDLWLFYRQVNNHSDDLQGSFHMLPCNMDRRLTADRG